MPTPIAVPAIGTVISAGDGASPEVFTTISNQSSITGMGLGVNMVDVTSHSSSTPWRQKVPTLLDAGDISFDMFFVPADSGHKRILTLFSDRGQGGVAGVPINFKLTFADASHTVWPFQGFVSKFSQSAPVDGVLKAAVTITATGEPTFPA